ncbi:MAG: nucleotidyltransferase domain-containing protein [Porticoccaceae bacterium]|nr:MAG: nucleotidyltransferase domain-containing protein [Porticoccaceae bacterium]
MARVLASDEDLRFAILFGSLATGHAGPDSDLDVAVFATGPLGAERKIALIARLAEITGRPVDLLDLRTAGVLVTREALTRGRLLFCRDRGAYRELAARTVIDAADFLPYVERLLRERRSAWIG